MNNRKAKPALRNSAGFPGIEKEDITLNNGMPVYFLNKPDQEILKIEFMFYAGSFYQGKKLISASTASMLKEGTKKLKSDKISEIFDFYGVYASFDSQKDFVSIVIYCLEKHLGPVLELVEGIIKNPSFPEDELKIYLKNLEQQHIVSLEKVNTIARMQFGKVLYGSSHPYGQVLDLDDFNHINHNDLASFHNKFYNANNGFCIIAGGTAEKVMPVFEKHFGGNDWMSHTNNNKTLISTVRKPKNVYIEKEDALQSAIRIGRICPGITHKDYHMLKITNVILGGYFGSRLMKNIRQEKGYTYGINSNIVSLLNSAYFFVSSQVGSDVCQKATDEVYTEINKLINEPVCDSELSIVRNYLLGTLLRSFDGVFAKAARLKELIAFNLDNSHYASYLEVLKSIKPGDIIKTAEKYFNSDEMSELIVGKK